MLLLTNASTAVWGSSIPEGVNVCLDLFQICSIIKIKRFSCEKLGMALNSLLAVTNIY